MLGPNFRLSGYRLRWNTTSAGNGVHTLYIYARSPLCGWSAPVSRQVTVSNCDLRLSLDRPRSWASLRAPIEISGWALDLRSISGTGVEKVSIWLDGPRNQGQHLQDITSFHARPDMESLLGAKFRDCGYGWIWDRSGVANGQHTLYVYAYSPSCGWSQSKTTTFTLYGDATPRPTVTPTATRTATVRPSTTPTRTPTLPAYPPPATRTPTPSRTPTTESPRRIYFDDFSDPSSGWPVVEDESRRLGYLDGEYQMLIKDANTGWLVSPGFRCANCTVEVDAWYASTAIGHYGLIFGVTDDWDCYQLVIDGRGYYSLYKQISGELHALMAWTPSSAINQGRTPNRVSIMRNDHEIVVHINGQHAATLSDTSIVGYLRVGLLAGARESPQVDARFDSFAVYGNGASTSSRAEAGESAMLAIPPHPSGIVE